MRIALLIALVGCTTSEPVREGKARIQVGASERDATATYRVVSGSNETACAHGEHYSPHRGAEVRFGPTGGEHVQLSETTAGTYTASVPAMYAPTYQFTVDGELFELVSPPLFTATITMSASKPTIEFSDASTPSDIVIHLPDGRTTARTLVGSPATVDVDLARGQYPIDLLRTADGEFGVVEIERQLTLTVP